MWQIVAGLRCGTKRTGPRLKFHPGPFIKEKQAEVPSGRLAINFDQVGQAEALSTYLSCITPWYCCQILCKKFFNGPTHWNLKIKVKHLILSEKKSSIRPLSDHISRRIIIAYPYLAFICTDRKAATNLIRLLPNDLCIMAANLPVPAGVGSI